MDLGIKGRTAIVCAASKGLGKGCALALAQEGVNVVITARTKSELEATAEEIPLRTRSSGRPADHYRSSPNCR
jgi:3-oxoacyl-[acyl-carrier protein] reductase